MLLSMLMHIARSKIESMVNPSLRTDIRSEPDSISLLDKYGKPAILYFFLMTGSLLHILGSFQDSMQEMASPVIIGLGLWLFYEFYKSISRNQQSEMPDKKALVRFSTWSLFVVAAGIGIEWLGVETGLVFGRYSYGVHLTPVIDHVPIAIGFAWLGMLISSLALAQKLLGEWFFKQRFFTAIIVSLLMTIFDFFMEPAATKLGYWNWIENAIPARNYIAWFLISFVFAYLGISQKLFFRKLPAIGLHAYFGQLAYFLMVAF